MTRHRNWALPTAALIVVFATIVFYLRDSWGSRKRLLSLFALIALTCSILVVAWLGAETVYRYGIGVISIPKVDTSHQHNAAAEEPDEFQETQEPEHGGHEGHQHHH